MKLTALPTLASRIRALTLLFALVTSWGLGFEASLCPPGMSMGSDMTMAEDGVPCPFAASSQSGENGTEGCPFSVGGVGPCTTVVPPSVSGSLLPDADFLRSAALVAPLGGLVDHTGTILLPPPRA